MKKILLITTVAFIIASILAIMFTFQASSTFRNFSDDNGDNGDDNVNLSNLNLIQNNYIENKEDLNILIKEQYFTVNYRNRFLNSREFFSCIENTNIGNKILPRNMKFS